MTRVDGACIGIMISDGPGPHGAQDSDFLRRLCAYGRMLGHTVFVFSPGAVDPGAPAIAGFSLDSAGMWTERDYPFPHAVYNRCFSPSRRQYRNQVRALLALKRRGCTVINTGLSGKWDVYLLLRNDPAIRRHLPATMNVRGTATLRRWFERYPHAFLKPHGGSQGRSTAQIKRAPDGGYVAHARTSRNEELRLRFSDFAQLSSWADRWIGTQKFLIQPCLNLQASSGCVFDIRALVQKGGNGRWRLTGMAVRLGAPGSTTSNLHGGGTACALEPFLHEQFGEAQAERILARLKRLAETVPPAVEAGFGRLCELGLDFGLEPDGRIWLLEVNSKPGRAVFRKLRMNKERQRSIVNPLLYASYVLQHRLAPFRPQIVRVMRPFIGNDAQTRASQEGTK